MGRLAVEQVVTVDGYAAEPDGGIGFFEAFAPEDLVDENQLEFMQHVDAILFGANTYRMFTDYWPTADADAEPVAEPINRLPKFVVSNTLADAPWGDGSIEILRGDGAEAAAALKQRFERIVVWGSLTLADALFEAGLVEEVRLRMVPVLIGDGRSFTPSGLERRRLALDSITPHPSGYVGMNYRVR
ncbi:dihydrofolate reductase family protein [Agromyces sp. SYSU K20354]|uniref:dihydrofolate reductase family protein n=1 Tax=Agromyces cavernae TaxID=2898659 RepID=UPI001E2D2887|nr:dihydrofolate reductase family protein [Agromyces cavernae]MCD2441089.1 dihydrofolate reductase family protein [Agromyces cavernae]